VAGSPGSAMTIRAARPEDAAAVAGLCAELGYPIPVEQARAHIEHDGGVALIVAEMPHRGLVGWIEVAPRQSVEVGRIAEIQGLVVTAAERGREIGTRLLEAAERWALRSGYARIRVRSNVVRERTHRFYAQRGYVERKRQIVFDKQLRAATPADGGEC
jgi:GNAT superfamily N-acetyltransferase